MTDLSSSLLPPVPRHRSASPRFILSVDLGQAHDYTAIGVLERAEDSLNLTHIERLKLGTPYPTQVARLVSLATSPPLLGACVLAVDATGVGRAVMDMLEVALRPLPIRPTTYPVTITGGDTAHHDVEGWRVPKRDLIAAAQVALQQSKLKVASRLPDSATLVSEMLAYRVKIAQDGHDSYANDWREQPNDDLVLMLAIAVYTAGQIWVGGPARMGGSQLRRANLMPGRRGT